MVPTQFLHAETYGRAPPRKARERRLTVRKLIAELRRESGAHPHVAHPQAPEVVFGDEPSSVERELTMAAEQATDPRGRRLRCDAQVVVAGTASFPVRVDEMTAFDWADYAAWERDTVEWLKTEYGDRLRCVLRHGLDESHPHLHWLAVPRLAGGERVEALHPGKAAIAAAKAEGIREKKVLDQRYRAAMRQWQDRYWSAVGAKHGLGRYGPRRRRLSRAAWQAERRSADLAAAVATERDQLRDQNRRLHHEMERLRQGLAQVTAQARAMVRAVVDPVRDTLLAARPAWLTVADWEGLLRHTRAVSAVLAYRASLRPSAASRVVRHVTERTR